MTRKDNPMVNNLARVRARESAESWLADRKLAMPIPPRVSAAFAEQAMADALAAGWTERGQARALPDLVAAMAGVALIEEGAGWVKIHGVADVRALFDVLRLARMAAEAGQPDGENPEAGEGWFKRARLITPGEDSVVAHGEPLCDIEFPVAEAGEPIPMVGSAIWRTEGVADLAAFRITTGDPRFDPAGPVTVNGFLYHPAKEN
jgi:hypothetical protein